MLLLGSTDLMHSHFDYDQPLTVRIRMRICYLDSPDRHLAGLCCYLVIHIENLLRPLQLFFSIRDVITDSPSYNQT
jgi:hypothetical protein